MKLKVKQLKLSVGKPVAILHTNTAERLQVQEDNRIKLRKYYKEGSKRKWITAVVDVAFSILKENEIALTQDVIKALGIKQGSYVELMTEVHPTSINYVIKKMNGGKLNYTEIYSIISDISKGRLTKAEIAYFTSGCYYSGLDFNEMVNLTKAMVKTGAILKHKNKFVLDLHCAGGVAGNRTSPIVVSLVGSAIEYLKLDAVLPKTASRAITSAAGTSDVMETVSRVEFTVPEIYRILKKTKACLVWNSALKLSPADDRIVKVETLVSLDAEAQIISSILSKKIADGATHVLMDIPYGYGAKFDVTGAIAIKKKFLKMASKFGLKMKVILTEGNKPIGRGIGPVLEMLDVLSVLKHQKNRPRDLEKKSIMLSAELLSLTKNISKSKAISICKLLLYSGRAYKKFKQIVIAQGGKFNFEDLLKKAKFKLKIKTKKTGKVKAINNKKIALVAKIAGCPGDKGSGVYLCKHIGDKVLVGDTLFTIYSESKEKLKYAEKIAKQAFPFIIS